MPAFRPHTPEEIEQARILYEETDLSPQDVARILGLGVNTFYRRVKRWGWRRRRLRVEEVDAMALAAAASRDEALAAAGRKALDDRRSTLDRAEDAVMAQLAALEAVQERVALAAVTVIDGARAGRALQNLVRALGDVQRVRQMQDAAARRAREEAAEEERGRVELHRRITALAREETMRRQEAAALEAAALQPAPETPPLRRAPGRPRVIGF